MKSQPPIGLDLGSHTIKAFQFDRHGDTLATASIRRETPGSAICEDEVSRIAGVLYRRGFVGHRVALAAPKEIIHRLTIELPPLDSGAPIEAIAETELCRQRNLEPGSFEFHWFESPQPPRHASGARAIAISCKHVDASSVLDLFDAGGLDPVALHSADIVLADTVAGPHYPGTTAILDLGWSDATFIAAQGGVVRFVRSITSCGLSELVGEESWFESGLTSTIRNAITDGHSDGNNNTPVPKEYESVFKRYRGALAAELMSSLQYLEGCGPSETPKSIVITGGGIGVSGLRESLESATGMTATTLHKAAQSPLAIAAALSSSQYARMNSHEEVAA